MTLPTPAQVEALIERLHKNCPNNGERHIGGGQLADCICDRCDAASALAALRDENAALRSKLGEKLERHRCQVCGNYECEHTREGLT